MRQNCGFIQFYSNDILCCCMLALRNAFKIKKMQNKEPAKIQNFGVATTCAMVVMLETYFVPGKTPIRKYWAPCSISRHCAYCIPCRGTTEQTTKPVNWVTQ